MIGYGAMITIYICIYMYIIILCVGIAMLCLSYADVGSKVCYQQSQFVSRILSARRIYDDELCGGMRMWGVGANSD